MQNLTTTLFPDIMNAFTYQTSKLQYASILVHMITGLEREWEVEGYRGLRGKGRVSGGIALPPSETS